MCVFTYGYMYLEIVCKNPINSNAHYGSCLYFAKGLILK